VFSRCLDALSLASLAGLKNGEAMSYLPLPSHTLPTKIENKIAINKPSSGGINLIKTGFHFSSAFVGTNKMLTF